MLSSSLEQKVSRPILFELPLYTLRVNVFHMAQSNLRKQKRKEEYEMTGS